MVVFRHVEFSLGMRGTHTISLRIVTSNELSNSRGIVRAADKTKELRRRQRARNIGHPKLTREIWRLRRQAAGR